MVALPTPMTSSGAVDYVSYGNLLQWHVRSGTSSCVILGTTGEGQLLEASERQMLIRAAVSTCPKDFPIIVGSGTIDAKTTVQQCKDALLGGAFATLVITPPYVKPPQRALVKYYIDIANEVSIPMLIYNCPGRTGVDMSPESIAEASYHPNIIGVKEASGYYERAATLRSLCQNDFLLFSGDDATAYDFVQAGGDGVISVTANVVPDLMQRLMQAALCRSGDGHHIQELLAPLHRSLFLESNPIPVKKALQMMNKIGSGIRQPLCELDPSLEPVLREALLRCGAL